MAVLTPVATVDPGVGQGMFRIYTFTSVADTDTFNGPKGARAFWAAQTGNPSTQASAGISVIYVASTGVFTFHPGENSLGLNLFVVGG